MEAVGQATITRWIFVKRCRTFMQFTGYADVIGAVLREILIAQFIMAASKARLLELCEIILRELIAVSIMAASKVSHEGLCEIL